MGFLRKGRDREGAVSLKGLEVVQGPSPPLPSPTRPPLLWGLPAPLHTRHKADAAASGQVSGHKKYFCFVVSQRGHHQGGISVDRKHTRLEGLENLGPP